MAASSPVEAEATGQKFVTAAFGGTDFQVPLDVDFWPTRTILNCRLAHEDGDRLIVNTAALVAALRQLLGEEQWPAFAAVAPKKRSLVPASHVFAAAVGMPRDDTRPASDIAFGAIPRILTLLEHLGSRVESDLDRFWGIDYRDRWRFTEDGHRLLTLRQIYARLGTDIPRDSVIAIAQNDGVLPLSDAAVVSMDLYEALTKTRHPARPLSPEQKAARDQQQAAEVQARTQYQARQAKRSRTHHHDVARENARRLQEGAQNAQHQDEGKAEVG